MKRRYDGRRKYYLILDCETATLPVAANYPEEEEKTRISIAKPLIYDLGWTVVDANGNIYARKNYLIAETFSNPVIFDTAYYRDKRPGYIEKISMGEISVVLWEQAIEDLLLDMAEVEAVGAYNAMFDFKKAIPFTDLYLSKVYSPDFQEWLDYQNKIVDNIAKGHPSSNEKEFEAEVFRFRGQVFKLFDVWGLSCRHLLNNDDYKRMCIDNEWNTASGKYFKTSAEVAYRFCMGQQDFEEAHTALDDAIIESVLFGMIAKKTKKSFEMGIIYFPFKELGLVEDFQ